MASNATSAEATQSTVAQESNTSDDIRSTFRKIMIACGFSMIADGLLSVILSIIGVVHNDTFVTDYVGSGIWSGLFFIATGLCALNVFKNAVTHMVIITMVMSAVSFILSTVMIGVISFSLDRQKSDTTHNGFKAVSGLLIILGLVETALSVCCFVIGVLLLRRNGQQARPLQLDHNGTRNYDSSSNDGRAPTGNESGQTQAATISNDPFPFSTMEHQKSTKWMGIAQGICGIASVILGIITVSLGHGIDVGAGIWCGITLVTNGCLAFFAACTRSKRLAIATLIVSLISASILINLLVWPSVNLSILSSCLSSYTAYCQWKSALAIAHGLLFVLGIGELIMSVWCAVICSLAVCRPGCCTWCIPQVVLHVQEGDRQPRATQDALQHVTITATANEYTTGSQIHLDIHLPGDHELNRN